MSEQYIKDAICTRNTPVVHGHPESLIYDSGFVFRPGVPGKQDTAYTRKIYLPELLPLEDYDHIIVLFSGGKDSAAAYFRLLELGVPKNRMELWHHSIDGGHPDRRMDWPVTENYVRAFAEAEGVSLRVSSRINGFWGEVYRVGASYPIEYEDDDGSTKICPPTTKQLESERLRKQILSKLEPELANQLKEFGCRMKFPAKSGDLSRRWCSAYLKIDVAKSVICNLESLQTAQQNTNILVVSGERRGESAGRAKYNEMEIHRTNATTRAHRLVHQWRAVIDYSERDIWELLRRHNVVPHPCYACGWNRCSCALCIFGLPRHWAGIRELFPEEYEKVRQDEIRLGFTIDNKKDLDAFVGNAESCVYHGDPNALHQLVTGEFIVKDIYCTGAWDFPAGAFRGAEGGPC